MNTQDIHVLQLVDGLKSTVGTQEVRYRTVRLREVNVADEYAALQMAERVVHVNGKPTLLVSDELYRIALTLRHVKCFQASGLDDIGLELLNLDMFGRLSPHDLHRIEERVVLVDLAAQLRHGLISHADFDAMLAGGKEAPGPRSEGQAAAVGEAGAATESGPAMLADYGASDATGATAGAGARAGSRE
jgi:phage FluMu protein gp41